MSHTKGEWRRTPINTIINAKTKKVIARLARGGRSQKELTANARLIAAAPDLLEACERALRFGLNPSLEKIVQAAITKAILLQS